MLQIYGHNESIKAAHGKETDTLYSWAHMGKKILSFLKHFEIKFIQILFRHSQVIGIISSSPNFFFFTTVDIPREDRVVCYAEWPDTDGDNHSLQEYV